ncbi:MAG: type II toxin-antitoxin system Phd/YefM family antitoxin [Clostridia bacterium]|nr:type II toxin-antitoxin system Phd/YefM family antitoxin [Clostridia bacterium]
MTVKFDFRQMVSISDLQRKLGEISEKVSEQDVLVLKNNKPEFIIVAPDKYEELIKAFDLIEQLDIYETIEKRREKSSLNGKQMLELLGKSEEAATAQANDS